MENGAERIDRVQDGRPRHWFYIDNAVIDQHAAEIGAMGLAVYMALVRHANGSGQAFPSLRRLERLLSLSRHTLIKYLEILEKHGLIARQHRLSPDGDATSTLYVILPVGGAPDAPRGEINAPPSATDTPRVVQHVHHGGAARAPEGLKIFKDSRDLKDSREATPSVGRPPALVFEDVSTQISRKKTYFPEDPDAQERLRLQVLTPTLQAWATAKGVTCDLAQEWEHFRGKAIANAYRYSHWPQAFRNWLTNDYQRPATPVRKTNAQRAQELEAWAQQQKEM